MNIDQAQFRLRGQDARYGSLFAVGDADDFVGSRPQDRFQQGLGANIVLDEEYPGHGLSLVIDAGDR